MNEISYIHSEAYAAGELKHGTIFLIENGTLVISILTQNHLYEKTVSNMVEVKARGTFFRQPCRHPAPTPGLLRIRCERTGCR